MLFIQYLYIIIISPFCTVLCVIWTCVCNKALFIYEKFFMPPNHVISVLRNYLGTTQT